MSTAYYRGAQACILAFDVTDRSSFDGEGGGIRGWLDEVRKENQVSHFCTFLVGLKCDLKDHRQVQMSEGIALAKEIGAEYWEVSSKEDINVKELFDRVAVQSFEQSLEKAVAVSSQSAVTTDERVREEACGPETLQADDAEEEDEQDATLAVAPPVLVEAPPAETNKNTAMVALGSNGSTTIHSGISLDGKGHAHTGHLGPLLPKTLPYDLALRCDTDGNVPQIQFNNDGVWHDFAPEGRAGLKAGPWFPYLKLNKGARLSDHRVQPSQPAPAPAPPPPPQPAQDALPPGGWMHSAKGSTAGGQPHSVCGYNNLASMAGRGAYGTDFQAPVFDQFSVNESKYGVSSTYDEQSFDDMFQTSSMAALRKDANFEKMAAEADRIAREMVRESRGVSTAPPPALERGGPPAHIIRKRAPRSRAGVRTHATAPCHLLSCSACRHCCFSPDPDPH